MAASISPTYLYHQGENVLVLNNKYFHIQIYLIAQIIHQNLDVNLPHLCCGIISFISLVPGSGLRLVGVIIF